MNVIERATAALKTRLEAAFTSAGLTEPLLISIAGQPRLSGPNPSQAVRVAYQSEDADALARVMPTIESVIDAAPKLAGLCRGMTLEPCVELPGVVATYVRIGLPVQA